MDHASISHISKCVKTFSDPTVPFLNKHQSLQCIGALDGILNQYMVILGYGCVRVAFNFNAQEHWKQSKILQVGKASVQCCYALDRYVIILGHVHDKMQRACKLDTFP